MACCIAGKSVSDLAAKEYEILNKFNSSGTYREILVFDESTAERPKLEEIMNCFLRYLKDEFGRKFQR